MFNRPTLRQLIARTLADMTSRLTTEEQLRRADSTVYARVLAGASHELHGYLDWISRQVIYDTADAEFLERWAGMFGIERKPAEFASGTVTASGAGLIPAGTLYRRSPDGAEFTVTADANAPGVVAVEASLAGASGNMATGTLSLLTPIAGVATAALVIAITNGSDAEDDAGLRGRFLDRLREPPNGGSAHDYVQWALEVPGVTRAWVYPQELGAGTVTVRFVRDNDASIIPDAGEVTAVFNHIQGVRPVTAQVYVFAPTPVALNFSIDLTPDTAETRAAVTASLQDMLTRESAPGATILLSHIREAVSIAAGETDSIVSVPAANVIHTTAQMATMGVITWL